MYFEKRFINKIFRLGFFFVIALLLLDIITYFYYQETVFQQIFLATREQTPLTWVSSIILFSIGIACASLYSRYRKIIWYLLSLTYIFFSIDDAIYFHERFTGSLQSSYIFLAEFPSYAWIVLYLPLMAFGLLGLVYLMWPKSSPLQKKKIVLAVVLLFIALSLDMLEGWVLKNNVLVFCANTNCEVVVTHLVRLTEEILEVLAFGILCKELLIEFCLAD